MGSGGGGQATVGLQQQGLVARREGGRLRLLQHRPERLVPGPRWGRPILHHAPQRFAPRDTGGQLPGRPPTPGETQVGQGRRTCGWIVEKCGGQVELGRLSRCGLLDRRDPPDPPLPVHVVVGLHPVAAVQAPVGGECETDGAEVRRAGDQWFGQRLPGTPPGLQFEAIDAVVTPTGDQQLPGERGGKLRRFTGDNPRRGFPRARRHRDRAGDFAIPRGERVQPLAAVAEAVAKVGTGPDRKESARGAAVGIVVDSEEPAQRINGAGVWIPEAGRDLLQATAIEPTAVEVAPFASPGEGGPVGPLEGVLGPQVLAEAKVQPVERVEREARQSVVRVIARGDQGQQFPPTVGVTVAIVIVQQPDGPPGRHQHRQLPAIGGGFELDLV